ncbi:MAG TPA: hypothetical protein VN950_28465 [Terriglobales bacterium]|nr:hypothetical protein [Terriglobales bacterium]
MLETDDRSPVLGRKLLGYRYGDFIRLREIPAELQSAVGFGSSATLQVFQPM